MSRTEQIQFAVVDPEGNQSTPFGPITVNWTDPVTGITEASVQANSGVLAGVTRVTVTGDQTITSPQSNKTFTGKITTGAGSSFTNCEFANSVYPTGATVTFTNCQMGLGGGGVWGDGTGSTHLFYRCEFIHADEGPHVQYWNNNGHTTGLIFQECWAHVLDDTAAQSQAHTENFHLAGVVGATFKNCSMDMSSPDPAQVALITANITLEATKPCSNVVIDGCWLHGGGFYQLYYWATGGTNSPTSPCRVVNTAFFTENTNTPQYPPASYTGLGAYPKFYGAGNTNGTTGAAITLPGAF